MSDLEKRFKNAVREISEEVSEKIGKPVHEIEEHIHADFERIKGKIPEEKRRHLKKSLIKLGSPLLYPALVFSYTGGNPNPDIISILAVGGFIVGQIEAEGFPKSLDEALRSVEKRFGIKRLDDVGLK